jgi:hypothetical protein
MLCMCICGCGEVGTEMVSLSHLIIYTVLKAAVWYFGLALGLGPKVILWVCSWHWV